MMGPQPRLVADGLVSHARNRGDLVNAETCLLRLLEILPPTQTVPHQGGEENLKTWDLRLTARKYLALVCQAQKRFAEAEAHWRAALAEREVFPTAWHGLGEVYLAQGRWAQLEQIADHLANGLGLGVQALVLRGRGHLARREFAAARQLVEEATAQAPEAEYSWQALSYVLLQEGQDWPAAEQALRKVLALNPSNSEARHNLGILLREQGRAPDG